MRFTQKLPYDHRIENDQKPRASRVGNFIGVHVALRMLINHCAGLVSKFPFLANRNAELVVPPLFWPVHCIKIREHVIPYTVLITLNHLDDLT